MAPWEDIVSAIIVGAMAKPQFRTYLRVNRSKMKKNGDKALHVISMMV